MNKSLSRFLVFLLGGLAVTAPAAHGNIVFGVSGVAPQAIGHVTLSGTITIDTAFGSVVSGSLTMSSGVSFTGFTVTSPFSGVGLGNVYEITFGGGPQVRLFLPTPTLVGYAGGGICTVSPCNGMALGNTSYATDASLRQVDFTSGTLTGPPPPVPEPAAIGMVGLGLAMLKLVRRKRRACEHRAETQGLSNIETGADRGKGVPGRLCVYKVPPIRSGVSSSQSSSSRAASCIKRPPTYALPVASTATESPSSRSLPPMYVE